MCGSFLPRCVLKEMSLSGEQMRSSSMMDPVSCAACRGSEAERGGRRGRVSATPWRWSWVTGWRLEGMGGALTGGGRATVFSGYSSENRNPFKTYEFFAFFFLQMRMASAGGRRQKGIIDMESRADRGHISLFFSQNSDFLSEFLSSQGFPVTSRPVENAGASWGQDPPQIFIFANIPQISHLISDHLFGLLQRLGNVCNFTCRVILAPSVVTLCTCRVTLSYLWLCRSSLFSWNLLVKSSGGNKDYVVKDKYSSLYCDRKLSKLGKSNIQIIIMQQHLSSTPKILVLGQFIL